jgi:hypothetical protein
MDGVHGKPVTTDTRAAQDLGPILQRQIPNVVQVGTDNRVKLARYRADRPIRKPLISGWTARERHPTNIKKPVTRSASTVVDDGRPDRRSRCKSDRFGGR